MADWTTIDPNTLLPGEPWTSAKALAAFENVDAQAEGAPGAPKNLGRSMDIDAGNLSGSTPLIDLGDCAKLLLSATAVDSVGVGVNPSPSIGYQLSSNNGSTWGSTVTIASANYIGSGGSGSSGIAAGTVIVNMTGFNAIRLAGSGTLSGAAIWVEGE